MIPEEFGLILKSLGKKSGETGNQLINRDPNQINEEDQKNGGEGLSCNLYCKRLVHTILFIESIITVQLTSF